MARIGKKRVAAGVGGGVAGAEDELNNRLFFRLLQASNIYERKAQNELGYSAIQGALLGALSRDRASGVPLADLVEYLSVSRQNLDGVLKRLEKLGQVERIEDPANRRVKVVRLTAAGAAAWDALFARSLEFYRQGTEGVSVQAKSAFAETLVRIIRALRSIELGPAEGTERAERPARARAAAEAPRAATVKRRATAPRRAGLKE